MTSFQKKVYEIVIKIPLGKVLTYKEVAKKTGRPFAWRAVGNILNKNPEGSPLSAGSYGVGKNPKIPCHRVIRNDGRIGGYNKGTAKKIAILKREGIKIRNGKIAKWESQSKNRPSKSGTVSLFYFTISIILSKIFG